MSLTGQASRFTLKFKILLKYLKHYCQTVLSGGFLKIDAITSARELSKLENLLPIRYFLLTLTGNKDCFYDLNLREPYYTSCCRCSEILRREFSARFQKFEKKKKKKKKEEEEEEGGDEVCRSYKKKKKKKKTLILKLP